MFLEELLLLHPTKPSVALGARDNAELATDGLADEPLYRSF